ncbi:DUF3375 family protein [Tessaracoccus coleopterorum]|uniref:DUF3375 family protein n=1 Tax=Tessaracoccus coleopterorum TaxID=2714950 RepID=UPI001E4A87B8|nr:DUF3375 family protein [Tessaracoccus coleopterorum]
MSSPPFARTSAHRRGAARVPPTRAAHHAGHPEGRAFAGALRLIGEPEHIDHLADQLQTLMAKPFARLLDLEQRADLRAISRRVELGVEEVLTAQRRASHVITSQVRTHDPIRDRQVDDLLRDVMAGLQTWMQTSRPGDRVDPLRSFPSPTSATSDSR